MSKTQLVEIGETKEFALDERSHTCMTHYLVGVTFQNDLHEYINRSISVGSKPRRYLVNVSNANLPPVRVNSASHRIRERARLYIEKEATRALHKSRGGKAYVP